LDLLIFPLNDEDKSLNIKLCKEFECNICNFFGWENIITDLNINNRYGYSTSLFSKNEKNEGKINIMKNVKFLKRFFTNADTYKENEFRIYESDTLGKILFKNDELKYSSKLLELIVDNFSSEEFNFDYLKKKFEYFSDYFPILKILKSFNFFENDFSLYESNNNENQLNVFSFNFDVIFNLILYMFIENFNKEKKEIKFYLIENDGEKDKDFIDLLKNNFTYFKEFFENFEKN